MTPLFLIDVDGTVADCEHRAHFINGPREERDWDSFFDHERMFKDTPIAAAREHFRDGRFIHGDAIFCTARVASTAGVTLSWLITHGFAHGHTRLICKPDFIRTQNARVFKVSVMETIAKFEGREPILIEDYGEVRRSATKAGFLTMAAPDCWDDWLLPSGA